MYMLDPSTTHSFHCIICLQQCEVIGIQCVYERVSTRDGKSTPNFKVATQFFTQLIKKSLDTTECLKYVFPSDVNAGLHLKG